MNNNVTDAEILSFLRTNGSPALQQKLNEPNGESWCISHIRTDMENEGENLDVCWGWLEQEIAGI